jgi:FdhD protein
MCSQSGKSGEITTPAGDGAGLTAQVAITRIKAGERTDETDEVAREFSVLVLVDGRDVCRLQCSPAQFEELALGFLCTAGLVRPDAGRTETHCEVSDTEARVDAHLGLSDADIQLLRNNLVAGTGCGMGLFNVKGLDPLDCQRRINMFFEIGTAELTEAMRVFQKRSDVYRDTGGGHSAAVAFGGELITFAEDVGRHNAVDKVIGHCLINNVPLGDKIIVSSGRLSLDVVAKGIRAGVPVVVSRSAATEAAVQLARLAKLTLIGFLRGDRMNIYSAEWRVK